MVAVVVKGAFERELLSITARWTELDPAPALNVTEAGSGVTVMDCTAFSVTWTNVVAPPPVNGVIAIVPK